jgi:drug/metabolite transporter (DMT)-like permease
MSLSGFIGMMAGIPIYYFGTPFGFIERSGIYYHILFSILAGIFTTVGQFCYFGGVNLGSVEVAQLFINMKPIVQLIEEAIFLFLFPNLLAFFGIVVAILGASLLIFGKRETEHQHPDDMIQKPSP